MQKPTMSIGELADLAGLSRRAVRFYVQRGLLPPPEGYGRGAQYGQEHVDRLRQIQQLQQAGHSLTAIEQIIAGKQAPPPAGPAAPRMRPRRASSLWMRLEPAEGLELHIDVQRHNPDAKLLLAIQQAIRHVLQPGQDDLHRSSCGP